MPRTTITVQVLRELAQRHQRPKGELLHVLVVLGLPALDARWVRGRG